MDVNYFIISLLLYIVLFIIPIFLYLKFKQRVKPLKYLKIVGNSFQGILIGIIISSIFIILHFTKNTNNSFYSINFNLGILWLSGALVGLLEEIPFRGFLLQKLNEKMKFWKANLLTTITFVCMHIPKWLNSNMVILKSAMSIFVMSLILGYLLKKYKSLWIPIICHSVFNLSIWMGI